MNIGLIPSVKEPYKNQIEFSYEENLIKFINSLCSKPNIKILSDINCEYKYDILIISGGGGNDLYHLKKNNKNKIRNKITKHFINYSLKKKIPILGICYGAQFLAYKFKSRITRKEHLNRHKIKINLLNTKKEKIVNSYHNYVISSLGKNLVKIAEAKDKTIECFKHNKMKILGIMWHPERNKILSKYDIKIIKKVLCI